MEGWKLILLIGFWVILPLLLAGLIAAIMGSIRPEHAEECKRHPELRRYDNYILAAFGLANAPGAVVDVCRLLGGSVSLAVLTAVTVVRLVFFPGWIAISRARRRELVRLEAQNE